MNNIAENKTDGLNCIQADNGLCLYYGNVLFLLHNRNVPFITVKTEKGEVALTEYNVAKRSEKEYLLEFYRGDDFVSCYLTEQQGKVLVSIVNECNFSAVTFTLYKEPKRSVQGLLRGNQTESKISFYVDKRFFFENINIIDGTVSVLDKIYLTFSRPNAVFSLDFIHTPQEAEEADKENRPFETLRGCPVFTYFRNLDAFYRRRRNTYGYILPDEQFIDPLAYGERFGAKFLFAFTGVFEKESRFLKYFPKDIQVPVPNGVTVKFSSEGAFAGLKNVFRKYLDRYPDGLYLDLGESMTDATVVKAALLAVLPEYPKKFILLYSTPSRITDRCGYYMIRDPEMLFLHPEYKDVYRYSGENLLGAEISDWDKLENLTDCEAVVVRETKV